MVREIRYEVDFPQCTPKEFFDVIFADEVSVKIYHKLNSSEDGATVTPWENNARTVEFFKEIQLPGPISAIFGSNKIPIKEVQVLDRVGEEEFTVSSTPELQLGVGPTLSSTTRLTTRSKNGGSELAILITCTASGPWGMVTFIEGFMAEEAKTGIQSFLTFCETRIAESKLDLACSASEEDDSENVSFHDVQYETLSQCSFADNTILERRDSNGLLTTEALILTRVKRLEEELKISTQGMDVILKRVKDLEGSLITYQRNTKIALIGCSALSFVLLASLLAVRRHRL